MKAPANPMRGKSCLYFESVSRASRALRVFSDCFCQVQPCQAAAKVPMHVTIEPLQQYHNEVSEVARRDLPSLIQRILSGTHTGPMASVMGLGPATAHIQSFTGHWASAKTVPTLALNGRCFTCCWQAQKRPQHVGGTRVRQGTSIVITTEWRIKTCQMVSFRTGQGAVQRLPRL